LLRWSTARCASTLARTTRLLVPAAWLEDAPIDGEDLWVLAASGDAIAVLRWLMSSGEWLRRSRKERGRRGCEGIVEGRPPFIGTDVAVGAAAMSTTARVLQRSIELGEGGVLFRVSRRSSERRWLA
jgi:hypothetical protein